jgi:hypothetical protein
MFRQPWKTGGQILSEGVSNLMDRLLKKKQIEEEAKYKNSLLGIAKEKLPYELRKLAAEAGEEEEKQKQSAYFRSLFDDNKGSPSSGETVKASPDEQQVAFNKAASSTGGQAEPVPGATIPINGMNPKSSLNDMQNRLQKGEEITVIPAPSSKKAILDNYAGSTIPNTGIKIRDIKSWTVDGVRFDRYPSGKVVAQKVGPTLEEKAQVNLDVAEQREQSKANIKRTSELKDVGTMLHDYTNHIEALDKLLNESKDATGLGSGFKTNVLRLGSPESATFQTHATPMVGKLSKDIAERGGAVVSGMAQAGKPNLYQPHAYNKQMVTEQAKSTYKSFKLAQDEFKEMHPGKSIPKSLEFPKFFDKVRIKAPNGLTYIKTQKDAEKLAKKYPDAEILGNIYE